MAPPPLPNPRRELGLLLAPLGLVAWLLGGALLLGDTARPWPGRPLAGFAAALLGALLAAAGFSFLRAPRFSLRRRLGLAVVAPALLLFSLALLGAALSLGGDPAVPPSPDLRLGAIVLLLGSTAMLFALFRALVLRLHVPRWEARTWRFTPRWKDELACTSPQGTLLLGMPSHAPRVQLPTDEAWAREAPGWARARRAELHAELELWCQAHGIPIEAVERGWVDHRS